jgi:hypothetical protein
MLAAMAYSAGVHGQDGDASFAFDAPAVVRGVAGSALRVPVCAVLEPGSTAASEVDGWSIALRARSDDAELALGHAPCDPACAAAQLDVAQASVLFSTIYLLDPAAEPRSGPLAGSGPQGPSLAAATVLDRTPDGRLPAREVHTMARFWIDVVVPERPATIALEYVDGLCFVGRALENTLTVSMSTSLAAKRGAEIHIEPEAQRDFVRSDANEDGRIDISDAIAVFSVLFLGAPPFVCRDAADANDDGGLDLSDGVFTLVYLFALGPPPPPPFPKLGPDPTLDALSCPAP